MVPWKMVVLFFIQSSAQRTRTKRWEGKVCIGRLEDGGYAPILFCIVTINIILFINSVIWGEWS